MCCVILGAISSPQFGLYRSQPYDNIATLSQEPQLLPLADRANNYSETIRQDYRHTPAGSRSEYFSLRRSCNDRVVDNRTAGPVMMVDGNSLNYSAMQELKVDKLQSFQRAADEAMEVNSSSSHGSRRSGIPVSSTLL